MENVGQRIPIVPGVLLALAFATAGGYLGYEQRGWFLDAGVGTLTGLALWAALMYGVNNAGDGSDEPLRFVYS